MEHSNEQGILTIFLEGEISSSNAEKVEEEIESLLSSNEVKGIRLDMGRLNYMSSVGIRIVISLTQRYEDTAVIHVPSDIYDVFDMVGLPNVMRIEPK